MTDLPRRDLEKVSDVMVIGRMLSWVYRQYLETIIFCNSSYWSPLVDREGENISSPYQSPYRGHWYR